MFKSESEIFEDLYNSIYSSKTVETVQPKVIIESIVETVVEKQEDEQTEMERLVESIFSGNVDDDSDSEDSDDKDSDDKDSDDKDSDDDDDSDSDDDSKSKGSDDDSDSDEDKGSSDGELPNAGGAFKSQVKSLKNQYNDLLVDSFEKYSTEAIEDALDEVDSAFGENIEDLLDLALEKLKVKIMGDLGVEGSNDPEGLEAMMPPAAMGGGFDPAVGADKPMEIAIEN